MVVRALLVTAVFTLGLAAQAQAALPQQAGTVVLPGDASARLDGVAADDLVGGAVAVAGDVDGDGIADTIVGDDRAAGGAGQAIVSFGGPALLPSSFATLGTHGFTITGRPGDKAGVSVSGAGDVNRDGLDDLIVGASGGAFTAPGRAYVVFGSASTAAVDLGQLGSRGFEIDGPAVADLVGVAVAGAGDVDGDGFDDVLVGAPLSGPLGRSTAGQAFVVYGRSAVTPVDLASPGAAASAIQGDATQSQAGTAVAGLGDTNGDGLSDVVVGAPMRKVGNNTSTGIAYVVLGSGTRGDVDLASLTTARGFKITGSGKSNNAGSAVAGPGDVTGDGVPDVLVGAPGVHPGAGAGNVDQGRAYVVPGSAAPSDISLATGPGPGHAIRFDGVAANDRVGSAVAGAGDVNGDGHGDLLVAAKGTNGLRGAAYVVYGPVADDLVLPSLGDDGITITAPGAASAASVGSAVAGGGDLDGDGRDDVLVGEDHADPAGLVNAGSVHAVRGFGAAELGYAQGVAGTVGQPIASLAPSLLRRTGPASFSASGLPGGLTIDATSGTISGTPTQAVSGTATVTMSDLTGSVTADFAVAVDAAPAPADPPIVAIGPPLLPAPAPSASAALTLTGVSLAPRCLGRGRGAAADLELGYQLSDAARVTMTLQRRTSSGLRTPSRCPKPMKASDRRATYSDIGDPGAATRGSGYATVRQAVAAPRTAMGGARAASVRRPLTHTGPAARGRNSTALLRTLRVGKRLTPGRYRVLVQATRADGSRSQLATVWFWVLRAPKH